MVTTIKNFNNLQLDGSDNLKESQFINLKSSWNWQCITIYNLKENYFRLVSEHLPKLKVKSNVYQVVTS